MDKLFHKKIYRDTLERLRLPGYIYLAVCLIVTSLPILLRGDTKVLLRMEEIAPMLFVYLFIGPVTMVFSAFSFLFRRNASDFYHALPLRRTSLYGSVMLGALTWIWSTVILTVLAAVAEMALVGWPISAAYCLQLTLSIGIGATLVAACAGIGASVTGTRFAAFIVGGLVLFLPRFISLLCATLLGSIAPMLSVVNTGILLNPMLHIPASLFAMLAGGSVRMYNSDVVFAGTASQLYSLALAVVYLLACGALFHRRASEVAEFAAPSRRMQHVYRSLITMPLLFALACMVTVSTAGRSAGGDRNAVIILSVVSLLVYMLYELITTRRFKNLWPALKVFPFAVLFAGLVCAGVMLYGRAQMRVLPSASEIESICVEGAYARSYELLRAAEVTYTDPNMLQVTSDSLRYSYDNMHYNNGQAASGSRLIQIKLKNGRKLYRRPGMSPENALRFDTAMMENPEYRAALCLLPSGAEVLNVRAAFWENTLSEEDLGGKLWDMFREEYANLPQEKQLACKENMDIPQSMIDKPSNGNLGFWEEGALRSVGNINVEGTCEGKNFYSTYALNQLLPNTANYAARLHNAASQEQFDAIAAALAQNKAQELYVSVELRNVSYDGKTYSSSLLSLNANDLKWSMASEIPQRDIQGADMISDIAPIVTLLHEQDWNRLDVRQPYVRLSVQAVIQEEEGSRYVDAMELYIPLPEELLQLEPIQRSIEPLA